MKFCSVLQSAAHKIGYTVRRRSTSAVVAGAGIGLACSTLSSLPADEVAYDDFEALGPALVPFDLDYSSGFFADGTDWTKDFPAGWTLDNSGNTYDNSGIPGEFDGWSALDVNSWIAHAGVQAGRNRAFFGGGDRNVALVCDPDELDDNIDIDDGNKCNSFLSLDDVDINGADLSALAFSCDYDIVTYPDMHCAIEVRFDDGEWQALVDLDSNDFGNSTRFSTNNGEESSQGTFVAGTDFTAPDGATSMDVRLGCFDAGNDWWMAVDNLLIEDGTTTFYEEDFESLVDVMEPFDYTVNGAPTEPFDPSDGSDWTNDIPNWEIINDGPLDLPLKQMYRTSLEGAYQGWTAMDAQSWSEQAGQGRTLLKDAPPFFPERNTLLVADGDQHDDRKVDGEEGPPEGEFQYNSFIQRRYDLSNFQNNTVKITLDFEFRPFDSQRLLIEASFDGGSTWTTLTDLDSDSLDETANYWPFGIFDEEGNPTLFVTDLEPIVYQFVPSDGDGVTTFNATNSNSMILRFGAIEMDNDWWMAVDNVLIEADPQAFVFGDIGGDGNVDLSDFQLFTDILRGNEPYDPAADFNEDGDVTVADFNAWVNTFRGN